MTWFLFGRFGTPSILAIVSRQVPPGEVDQTRTRETTPRELWQGPIAALKSETEWFKKEALYGVESASLPVLQLLAVAVNFPVVAISSQPLFTFPLRSLDEVLADTPFPGAIRKKTAPRAASRPSVRSKSKPAPPPSDVGFGEVSS